MNFLLTKLPIQVTKNQALDLFQLLADVNRNMGRVSSELSHSILQNRILNLMLLKESVHSNRIEGIQITFMDMLEERVNQHLKLEKRHVQNYQATLQWGSSMIAAGYPVTTDLIKELHIALMGNARETIASSGEYRKIQNFIGSNKKLKDAVYTPVSADKINVYMENLDFFINGIPHSSFRTLNDKEGFILDETCDPIIKAAIVHAQFESIHPFFDGNGRVGRILIALGTIQEGIPIVLLSDELDKGRAHYFDLLNGIRRDNPDWYAWIKFFLTACGRVASSLLCKLKTAEELAFQGLDQCNLESERDIWLYTFSDPYTTEISIAKGLHISTETARKGLRSLADLGLLYADGNATQSKTYYNYDVTRIFND